MNVEAARERLARIVATAPRSGHYGASPSPEDIADALLPVVREIAAEELELAYAEDRTTVEKMTPIERLTCFVVKMEDLVVRADALKHPGVTLDGVATLGGDDAAGGG